VLDFCVIESEAKISAWSQRTCSLAEESIAIWPTRPPKGRA
jgi:hypothetical protein